MKKILLITICILLLTACKSTNDAIPQSPAVEPNIETEIESKIDESTEENIDTTEIISADKKELIEPLSYSTNGVPVSISKETTPFDYTAENFKSMAEECGYEYDTEYLDQLVLKFDGSVKTIYSFKYTGESQQPDTFLVTLIPNKSEYTSLDQFKKDFAACYAGGHEYAQNLNDNWLLFASACGTGAGDGSGRSIGCLEVKKVVMPTLKLN